MENDMSKKRNVAILILGIILILILLTGCKDKSTQKSDSNDEKTNTKDSNVLVCKGPDPFASTCRTTIPSIKDEDYEEEYVCYAYGNSIMTLTFDKNKENIENLKIDISYSKKNDEDVYDDAVNMYKDMCDEAPDDVTCKYSESNGKMNITIETESEEELETLVGWQGKSMKEIKEEIEKENKKNTEKGFSDMNIICE